MLYFFPELDPDYANRVRIERCCRIILDINQGYLTTADMNQAFSILDAIGIRRLSYYDCRSLLANLQALAYKDIGDSNRERVLRYILSIKSEKEYIEQTQQNVFDYQNDSKPVREYGSWILNYLKGASVTRIKTVQPQYNPTDPNKFMDEQKRSDNSNSDKKRDNNSSNQNQSSPNNSGNKDNRDRNTNPSGDQKKPASTNSSYAKNSGYTPDPFSRDLRNERDRDRWASSSTNKNRR